MRLVHRRDGGDAHECVLAERVETADSLLAQGRGLMFRRSIPADYALVFRFDRVQRRGLHMLFVPFDIDAMWLRDGAVTKTKRLAAWYGFGRGSADTIVELPAGTVDHVESGDTVRIERDPEK